MSVLYVPSNAFDCVERDPCPSPSALDDPIGSTQAMQDLPWPQLAILSGTYLARGRGGAYLEISGSVEKWGPSALAGKALK